MSSIAIDLSGQVFGRLTAVTRVGTDSGGRALWSCRCSCGASHNVASGHLRSGNTKSCGCLNVDSSTTHGMSTTSTYHTWESMKARCGNPKHKFYSRYGGRGIKLCSRWSMFENFYEDMGECPVGLSIERKDNNKGYTPDNCVWASDKQQSKNKSSNVNLTYNGRTQCISVWAKELGVSANTLYSRIRRGWSVPRTLEDLG